MIRLCFYQYLICKYIFLTIEVWIDFASLFLLNMFIDPFAEH